MGRCGSRRPSACRPRGVSRRCAARASRGRSRCGRAAAASCLVAGGCACFATPSPPERAPPRGECRVCRDIADKLDVRYAHTRGCYGRRPRCANTRAPLRRRSRRGTTPRPRTRNGFSSSVPWPRSKPGVRGARERTLHRRRRAASERHAEIRRRDAPVRVGVERRDERDEEPGDRHGSAGAVAAGGAPRAAHDGRRPCTASHEPARISASPATAPALNGSPSSVTP